MAVYLSRQAAAEALLSRCINQVRGEAAFSDMFYERERPLRAANVNNITTKKTGARTPKLAAGVPATVALNNAYPTLLVRSLPRSRCHRPQLPKMGRTMEGDPSP